MPYTREQIQSNLQPIRPDHPIFSDLPKKGRRYLDRDIPDGYFIVQDWCLDQGVAVYNTLVPDLTYTLQGVKYLFQVASSGFDPNKLSVDLIKNIMDNLNAEEMFEGGAIRQFPEFQLILKSELLKMPKGAEIIAAIQEIPEYSDLFLE